MHIGSLSREGWDRLSGRAKRMVLIGGIITLFLIPVLFLTVQHVVYSATITITYAPTLATARIGNSTVNAGDNAVAPGTYDVTISMKGFATYKETVKLKAGDKIAIAYALVSNDPSTANWYQEHTGDYTIAQTIGDSKADTSYTKLIQNFPISKILPLIGLYSTYRVDYGVSPTDSNKSVVYVSYDTDTYKQQAIDAVLAKGYNLNDYEVIYQQNAPAKTGSVSISGTSNLSSRGISANITDLVKQSLSESYTSYNGETVATITIADSVSHTTSADQSTDTYTTTIALNDKYIRNLTLIVTFDHLTIKSSASDGSGESTIYDGSHS